MKAFLSGFLGLGLIGLGIIVLGSALMFCLLAPVGSNIRSVVIGAALVASGFLISNWKPEQK